MPIVHPVFSGNFVFSKVYCHISDRAIPLKLGTREARGKGGKTETRQPIQGQGGSRKGERVGKEEEKKGCTYSQSRAGSTHTRK